MTSHGFSNCSLDETKCHLQMRWTDEESFSDWSVSIGDRSFRVHRYVVAIGPRSSTYLFNHMSNRAKHLGASTAPDHSVISIARAHFCLCYAEDERSCSCPSTLRNKILEFDAMLAEVFPNILRYMYDGVYGPSDYMELIPMWILADYLQIESLDAMLSGAFRRLLNIDNVSHFLTLVDSLRFRPEDIQPFCIDLLATHFDQCSYDQLQALRPTMLLNILNHDKLNANPDSIATFLCRYIRDMADDDRQELLDILMFLNQDHFELLAGDALYLFRLTETLLVELDDASNHNIVPSSALLDRVTLQQLQSRYLHSIAVHFDVLPRQEFNQLPLHVVLDLLDQNNLYAVSEDDVYDKIDSYSSEHRPELTVDEQRQLWKRCRFAYLTPAAMWRASTNGNVPNDVLSRGAILSRFEHQDVPSEMRIPAHRMMPRVTPNFDTVTSASTLTFVDGARTVRMSATVGQSTAFSRHLVKLEYNGSGSSSSMAAPMYWEFKVEGLRNVQGMYLGLVTPAAMQHATASLGNTPQSWGIQLSSGKKVNGGRLYSYGPMFARGDLIGMCLDNGSLTFFKNGRSLGVAFTGIRGRIVLPAVTLYRKDQQLSIAFRATAPMA